MFYKVCSGKVVKVVEAPKDKLTAEAKVAEINRRLNKPHKEEEDK